ncbi:tRNA uridine-5-carboxymethylaminomethyl(34) synthesis GTPase MnmE [Horticoccus sp. 23ND18S-11]|uniref:tRNA uridine-5-carboxymethylaminomethyl(34) synthesis GTPase MnmE n=1 Tax=Horticoccus sp. 23ND18S-11 TaxID=3391832 RepID=UPI0039C8C7C4
MPRFNDTIAAPATPAGTAALAVLRVSGPDTPGLATEIFGRPPLPRTARHADYRDRAGGLVDDVVLTFFKGPGSYTGEDALEISCHGNPYIVQRILADLLERGCRPAEPGEFTQRAFLNGRMDLSQAEAVMDLIHARGERALHAAQQQLRGSLGRKMNGLVEALLNVLARIEAYIDFPDEDLPVEDRDVVVRELARLYAETEELLATKHYGDLLRDGIKTVIVGEPNVGKSSLLNRLVGRERALVSPEPGTTRDFIEARITVGGHTLRLIDTAGLNTAPAPLEKLGMAKTRECLAEADLILAVLDSSTGAALPPELLVLDDRKSLIIFNKSDLSNYKQLTSLPQNALQVSAITGHGVDRLIGRVVAMADAFQTQVGGEAIAINARHAAALAEAKSALRGAQEKLVRGDGVELVASDLRAVLAAYGEIVGKVDNERMLDHLFAAFCIGK